MILIVNMSVVYFIHQWIGLLCTGYDTRCSTEQNYSSFPQRAVQSCVQRREELWDIYYVNNTVFCTMLLVIKQIHWQQILFKPSSNVTEGRIFLQIITNILICSSQRYRITWEDMEYSAEVIWTTFMVRFWCFVFPHAIKCGQNVHIWVNFFIASRNWDKICISVSFMQIYYCSQNDKLVCVM